jgi:hypothetical protein
MTEQAFPISNAAMAAIVGLVLVGIIGGLLRLLHKPDELLTQTDRAFGYLFLGRHFRRLHAWVRQRGWTLGPAGRNVLFAAAAALALALVLALSGGKAAAQDKPPAFQVTEARTEAAGYAIAHGLLISNLVRNCVQFRDALPMDPLAALAGWRQRNGEHVDAAQAYMVYARAAVAQRAGDAAADEYYAKATGEFADQAKSTLNDIFGPAGPRPAMCVRWTTAIQERLADLAQQPKYLPPLEEMLVFHRALQSGSR